MLVARARHSENQTGFAFYLALRDDDGFIVSVKMN